MRFYLPLICLAGLLAACSSIVEGEYQHITFETPGAIDPKCVIDNGAFKYVAYPPQTITISNRDPELIVHCHAYGNLDKTAHIPSHRPTSYYVNAANGFGPGVLVDWSTGAMNQYPERIVIDFTGEKPRPYPYPGYHIGYYENPAATGVEEFRPGKASLMRDQYDSVPSMQKRPITDEQLDDSGGTVIGPSESAPASPKNDPENGS
jgi:hypothetical protein